MALCYGEHLLTSTDERWSVHLALCMHEVLNLVVCVAHMPLSAGTNFGVCNIGNIWTVKRFFSKFLLDGVPADVIRTSSWRRRPRVSVHGGRMKVWE